MVGQHRTPGGVVGCPGWLGWVLAGALVGYLHHHGDPGPAARAAQATAHVRTVLIVVGVVLVLCCGGAVVGGFFLFRTVQEATGPAREATDAFITDLESGDRAAAYDLLCASTQRQFTRDAFAQGLDQQPKVRSHKIDWVNVSNFNGRVSATVTTQLTLDTGFVDQHNFALVKENGQWKVCGQPY
jgi:hypothetical protein